MGISISPTEQDTRRKVFNSFYDAAFDELHFRGGGKVVCTFADGATTTFEHTPTPKKEEEK